MGEGQATLGAKAGIWLAGRTALAAGFFQGESSRFCLLPGAAVFAELGIGWQRMAALGAIHGLQWLKNLRAMAAGMMSMSTTP